MKLEGSYSFSVSREKVWESLNDPKCLAEAIPGCKLLNPVSDDKYEMMIELGVGAIKGTYRGYAEISEKHVPDMYTLHIVAEGPTGTVDATAKIELSETNMGTTAKYSGEAQVGGLVAGVGQRILAGVAKLVVGQFFKSMDTIISKTA